MGVGGILVLTCVVVVVVVVGCRQVMGKCCKLSRLVYYLTDQTSDTETLTIHHNTSSYC